MLKTYSDILFELLNCPAPVLLSSKISEIHLKLTNYLSNKSNEQEENKEKIINDPKFIEAETFKHLISFFNELPSDFYKDHISKIIKPSRFTGWLL